MNIPPFHGTSHEKTIKDWLHECELNASIYNWKENDYKQIFGSRLRSDALLWHANRLRAHPNECYTDWKEALLENFKTPMDIERIKARFYALTQSPNQQVKHFIEKLESSYANIYGLSVQRNALTLNTDTSAVKEDILLKVFMGGILPSLKEIMLNSNLIHDYKWDTVKAAAETAEKIVITRKLAETTSINKISTEAREMFSIQAKEINDLKSKVTLLSSQHVIETSTSAGEVNAIEYQQKDEQSNSDQDEDFQPDTKFGKYSDTESRPTRFKGECFFCKKQGHMKQHCWKLHGRPEQSSY